MILLRILDSLDPMIDEDSLPIPVRRRLGYDTLPLQVQALLGHILPLLHYHHGKAASAEGLRSRVQRTWVVALSIVMVSEI